MIQLTPQDAQFLYIDRPEFRQAYISAYALVPDEASGRLPGREEITRWISDRAGIDRLRERLVRVPLDLDHPYWAEDPNFALRNHLHFHDGAGWEELRALLAELLTRPMDQTRPLWELHFISGVQGVPGTTGPAIVAVVKMHHAMGDGISSGQITEAFFGAEVVAPTQRVARNVGTRPHSRAGLVVRAIGSGPRTVAQFAGGLRVSRAATRRVQIERREGTYRTPQERRPRTVLNRMTGVDRCYEVEFFALSDFQAMKARFGEVTVNDLVLAVVGGALRNYLSEGEVVAGSLAAAVPMSIRGKGEANGKNQFVMMSVELQTDVEDPVARLRAIHQSVLDERTRMSRAAEAAADQSDLLLPGWVVRAMAWMAVGRTKSESETVPFANTFVTSVPRRSTGLRLCETTATVAFGLSTLGGYGAVAHSVGSAGDTLALNITADPGLLRDHRRYAELIRQSFEELRDASMKHVGD